MRLIFYWVCFSLSEPHTLPKSVITMEQIMGFSLPPSLTCIHSRAPLPSPKGGWMQKCLWCQPISPDLFIRLNQFTCCMLNFSHSVWAPVSKIKRAGGVINPYMCLHPKKKKESMEERVESVICGRQESWLECRQVHCWLEGRPLLAGQRLSPLEHFFMAHWQSNDL